MPSRALFGFALLSAPLILLLDSVAIANMADARFALHRTDPTTKTGSMCSTYSPNYQGLACIDYTVTGPAPGASLVYLVIGQAGTEGMAAASFGIDYDGRSGGHAGIDPTFVAWTDCLHAVWFRNDGGFGDFPNPKGGVRLSWDRTTNCQTQVIGAYGVHVVVGCFYLYAYSEDILRITPNNNLQSGPELVVCNCDNPDINPDVCTDLLLIYPPQIQDFLMGRVHLGGDGAAGYTPCGVTLNPATTWGKLKEMYR
jgi:hypothetical protein